MRRTVRSKAVNRILAGHDQGHYKLPADVVRLRDAADRIGKLPPLEPPRSEQSVWEQLVDDAVVGFIAGKKLPDPSAAVEANRDAAARWEREAQLRVEVGSQLEVTLAAALVENVDNIITDALQPALAEAVSEVKAAAAVLPPDVTPRQILSAPEETRLAWLRVESAAARYDAVRLAWDALGVPVGSDERGEFREFRNQAELWPQSRHRNVSQNPAPWPDEPVNRLLWLVRRGAEFIVPTAAEREQLWRVKYGAEAAQREQYHRQAAEYRSVFGG